MLPLERQQKILDLLIIHRALKLPELAEALQISMDTLRRDINILSKQGKLKKIYGGVKIVETDFSESPIYERMVSQLEEKMRIAKKCSEYIDDGDCVFLDSGSTTLQIAKFIKSKKNLTVITNSILVINELMNSQIDLIVIGGRIRSDEQSVVVYDYLFNFHELNIQKAFICASGITVEKGISDYNLDEAITRKKIIELSKEIFVAADYTKFGKDVTISIATLDKVDYIVTDDHVNKRWLTLFNKTNTELVIAN